MRVDSLLKLFSQQKFNFNRMLDSFLCLLTFGVILIFEGVIPSEEWFFRDYSEFNFDASKYIEL